MKKLFKNKKILLAMAVAGIIAASGLTYAWFRQTIATDMNSVKLGALHLNATVVDGAADWYYEPGEAAYNEYDIVNPATYATIPTIDALVKLNTNACVRLADIEGWVEGEDLEYGPLTTLDPSLFSIYLGNLPENLPFGMTDDGMGMAWMLFQTNDAYNTINGLTTPDVYLYMAGGRNVNQDVAVSFEAGIKFIGQADHLGEKYFGAEFEFGCVLNAATNEWESGNGNLVATQAFENWNYDADPVELIEGAPFTEWGITTYDLDALDLALFGRAAPVSTNSVGGITIEQAYQMAIDQIRGNN